MRLSLQIPDDLYDVYASRAEALAGRNGHAQVSAEELMASQLDSTKTLDPTLRNLIIPAEERAELERLLGGSPVGSAKVLLEKIDLLASLEIGEIKVQFTPNQWEQLKIRAGKQDRTVQFLVEEIVREMSWRFWDLA